MNRNTQNILLKLRYFWFREKYCHFEVNVKLCCFFSWNFQKQPEKGDFYDFKIYWCRRGKTINLRKLVFGQFPFGNFPTLTLGKYRFLIFFSIKNFFLIWLIFSLFAELEMFNKKTGITLFTIDSRIYYSEICS